MPHNRSTGHTRLPTPHLYTTLAPFYDRLDGAARDYAADVRWLNGVFRAHGVRTVLDVACGTAAHARGLARLGYDVTGMDASRQMLRIARQKMTRGHGALELVHGDYQSRRFPDSFDAAICMYWTLGAHLTDDEFRSALRQIRGNLRPKGLFAFDVENADGIKRAQLGHLFSDYVVPDRKGLLVRFNHSRLEGDSILDWQAIYLLQKGGKLEMLQDRVRLRFFHVAELKRLLHETSFKVLEVSDGPSREFDPTGPSIYVIAQRA